METGNRNQNRRAATGVVQLDASVVILAPLGTPGRASTRRTGVFTAPWRTTSPRKLKGSGRPQAEKTEETSKPGTSSTTPTTPTSPASPSKEDEKKDGGSAGSGKSEGLAKELIAEATSLLKTLQAMKRVKLKQVSVDRGDTANDRFALLDGGAHTRCELLTNTNVMIGVQWK